MSGGVMSNVALDAALDELGMLSSVSNGGQEYLAEKLSRIILQDHELGPRGTSEGMRTRASSMSTVNGRVRRVRRFWRVRQTPYVKTTLSNYTRNRTRSENESDPMVHLGHYSSNPLPHLDPVPYIALPIDSMLSSNLFKSRSMESIDARTSDESVGVIEELTPDPIASVAEVDSVSTGLHRLNVSE